MEIHNLPNTSMTFHATDDPSERTNNNVDSVAAFHCHPICCENMVENWKLKCGR